MKIRREKFIMGVLSERVSITCSLFEALRSLSEEEWGKVCMAPEEVPGAIPLLWSPNEDPRPKWLVLREKNQFSPASELSQGDI